MKNLKPGDKVYITKFALCAGIIEANLAFLGDDWLAVEWSEDDGLVIPTWKDNRWIANFWFSDCTPTLEAGLALADDMRKRKIAHLEKRISNLGEFEFKVIDTSQNVIQKYKIYDVYSSNLDDMEPKHTVHPSVFGSSSGE